MTNGNLTLGLASTKNETLNAALPCNTDFINLQEDRVTIDPNELGLVIDLLNEVVQQGRFSWKFGFVDYTTIYKHDEDHTLSLVTDNFDVTFD